MQKIESEFFDGIWNELMERGLPVHALLASQNHRECFRQYAFPYENDRMHRMFSITKSFVSLAIGFLISEGRISESDHIVDYFPEYRPAQGFHPWLSELTIAEMLRMETCYQKTTYKFNTAKNWVESFFTTMPDHRPGRMFNYDTSNTHTLAALCRKLTGKGVLDYLREKILDEIGFSRDAFILKDPFGSEIGGSGLCCHPSDLLKVGAWILEELSGSCPDHGIRAYLEAAVSRQVPTVHCGQTTDESMGYGLLFWQIRGGFAMYGMGGQYVLFYPEYHLVIVVCSNTVNTKGGQQQVLDVIHDHLRLLPDWSEHEKRQTTPRILKRSLRLNSVDPTELWDETICKAARRTAQNTLSLCWDCTDPENEAGSICVPGVAEQINFAFGRPLEGSVRDLRHKDSDRCFSEAYWTRPDELLIHVLLAGTESGDIFYNLRILDDSVTLWSRTNIEGKFDQVSGFSEYRI